MPDAHMTTSRHFDLVIVGASFAGLACARTAALRGLSVCVIEAKREPGARVHTTGILVKEAADELDVPHDLTRRVHGVRLYAPGGRHTDLFAPGYYFLTTRTAGLLRWMAREAARAGATLLCGGPFRGAERLGERIRIADLDIETRFLVGADGARSRVAQAFGLGRNSRFLVGIEAEYCGLEGVDPRFLHCFVDTALAPGYIAWAAPGPDTVQIGLATNMGQAPDLEAFRRKTAQLFRYEEARIVERRSGRIPCGGLVDPVGAPGVVLIGDAAGLVSPLTGGGIRLAFRSGRRAAQAISDRLLSFGPEPAAVLAREYPRFGLKTLMRKGLDLAPPNRLLDLAMTLPGIDRVASRIYFHRRGAPGMSWRSFEAALTLQLTASADGPEDR
jgi:flavin-dependent dehydrogenase